MNLSNLSIKRPVTILMIIFIILLLGFVSLTKLSLDLYPNIEIPVAVTITNYEGVGPEEIEEQITKPLEEQLGALEGLDSITSTSSQGSSIIVTYFDYGTDMDTTLNDIREKIDRIKGFLPDESNTPLVLNIDMNAMPVMYLGVTGDKGLDEIKKIVDEKIQPQLEKIPGVASVNVTGGRTKEIQVEVNPYMLEAYKLSMDDIRNAIASENKDISGGYIEEGVKDYLIKAEGEFTSISELEEILISLKTGGSIQLKNIAEVKEAYKEISNYTLLNGEQSVAISISKQSDANTVNVSDSIKEGLQELEASLPSGMQIEITSDQAQFIRDALNSVVRNALFGAVFAALVLFLFLRNVRSTLIIGTAIPISIIATFILMYFGGLTLNMISLGGLSLGIGMMVDNSIVILENIYRFRQEGYGLMEAAQKGAAEVGAAITASTLTTIAVFLPIVFVEGITAQIFKPLALTIVFSLTASLLVALSLIPMLSSRYLVLEENNGNKGFFKKLGRSWLAILERIDELYRNILGWALQRRKRVIFFTIILLIISIAAIPFVGMEFMPEQDTGEFSVSIQLPNNTHINETSKVISEIEALIAKLPEVESIFTSVGSDGGNGLGLSGGGKNTHLGNISVKLLPVTERDRGINKIMDEIRYKTANIPNADITVKADEKGLSGSSSPISISIKGDDLEVLKNIAETYAQRIKEVPGTREVTTSLSEGSPQVVINLDRKKAAQYGISSAQAFQNIKSGMNGVTASTFRKDGDEINIKIVLPEENRTNLDDLQKLRIQNLQGVYIPVEEIAKIEYTNGPTAIERDNQARKVTVTGSISGRDLGSVVKDIQEAVSDIIIPIGYEVEYGGSNEDMQESFASLGLALILAIILVYMVMASQFEALLDPFIIMFSLPPTLIGIIGGLVITGRSLSVPAFIGIIMLAGIVVNNAIVLVDYTNTLRKQGMNKLDALLKAGPTRLRPILMTTLTTVLALLPQALGIGEGAETMAPMATVVVFGLTLSTLITLVLIPVMYYIFDEFRQKRERKKDKISPSMS